MQVKEEPKDPEYKSCQFEVSASTTSNVSQATFDATVNNGHNMPQENVPLNSCSPLTFSSQASPTVNSCSTLPYSSQPQYNVLHKDTQPQFKKPFHIEPDVMQCLSDSDISQKYTQPMAVSHALPRRIAQMQQRLHPDLTQKRRALAQPKEGNNKRILLENLQPYSNALKEGRTANIVNSVCQSVDSLPLRGSEEITQNNLILNQRPGYFQTYHGPVKSPIQEIVDKSGCHGDGEQMPMQGLFGWTLIDNIYIPYIFRADNEKYVCVRLLEYKILRKYPNVFPEELANREPLTSSFIKPNECRIFNFLVRMQYRGQRDIPVLNQNDVVVLLNEFMEFYEIVMKSFPECSESHTKTADLRNPRAIRSGWFQVNNTIIPFVCRSRAKFLPLAVLKHAASIDVSSDGIPPTDEECKELNKRCAAEGFKFTFKQSSRLVSLSDVEKIIGIQIFELPEKDPLHHAQYLSSEDNITDGLRIITNEMDVPNVRAFQQFVGQEPLLSPNSEHEFDEYGNGEFGEQPVTFSYNRFPSNIKYGSPNVSIIPRQQFHLSRMPANINKRGFMSNIRPVSSVRLESPKPPPAHTHNFAQRIIPGTFVNALSPGQNINVNYGINIQNITPAHHTRKPPDKKEQVQFVKEQMSDTPEVLATNLHYFHPTKISPSGGIVTITSKAPTYQNQSAQKGNINVPTINLSSASVNMVKSSVCVSNSNQDISVSNTLCRNTGNNEQNHPHERPLESNLNNPKPYDSVAIATQHENTYQMKQRQAIKEIMSCIKGVWLCGKNISCLHLNKPGRTGKFCLVEAVCKLYYCNRTVSEFLFTIEKVLMTITCTELEEQAFIEYYQLPVNVLKCNKMIELTAFERLYPQLTEVLSGVYPDYFQPPSNTRCLLPLPDSVSPYLPRPRRSPREQERTENKATTKDDDSNEENKVIVLDI